MPQTWYKLDNVAKVFIATNTRRDPRVFRVSCTLDETVDPALLQTVLRKTVRQFPNFQVTLHRGLFWHYLESTAQQPNVVEEDKAPCAELYADGGNALLYRVSCCGCRINLEMFHVLTDGNGALVFLKELVAGYLRAAHPEQLKGFTTGHDASEAQLAQDSFRQFYAKTGGSAPATQRAPRAYRLHGLKLPYYQTQYFEAHLSAKALLATAKAAGVTLTSWLGAAIMLAVHAEMPALERNRPVVISLPVNLRNYYPSATARNFFNTIQVRHTFTGGETLGSLATEFDAALKNELSEDTVRTRMDSYEKLERNPALKVVPLQIKNLAVSFFNWLTTHEETLVLSNMGRIQADEPLMPYIKGFSSFSSTYSMFICVLSYGDDLCLGASSVWRSTNVLKNLFRTVSNAVPDFTLYATEVEHL